MNHKQEIIELKKEKKDKYNRIFVQTLFAILLGGIVIFFYRGFTDKDYERGHAFSKLGEILVDTAILQLVVFVIAIVAVRIFLNSHYASREQLVLTLQQQETEKKQAEQKAEALLRVRLYEIFRELESTTPFSISMKIKEHKEIYYLQLSSINYSMTL